MLANEILRDAKIVVIDRDNALASRFVGKEESDVAPLNGIPREVLLQRWKFLQIALLPLRREILHTKPALLPKFATESFRFGRCFLIAYDNKEGIVPVRFRILGIVRKKFRHVYRRRYYSATHVMEKGRGRPARRSLAPSSTLRRPSSRGMRGFHPMRSLRSVVSAQRGTTPTGFLASGAGTAL